MKEKKFYERPLTEALDVFPERVLCQSPGTYDEDVDPENMTLQNGLW
jgi:hypothetical protein